MNYHEENNYPKAFAATGIILAAIMALCYFIVFTNPPPPEEGTGGILVNYGTTDEGMGSDYMSTEQPSVAEKANKTRPDKITPAPPTDQKTATESSDKNVVTQNTEDAPEIAANSKKPSATVTQATKAVVKPTVNQNALYKGPSNHGTGEGDGTTNTPGNQGKPTGSTLTNNYNGTGSGNGGNLSGLGQRNFVNKPVVSNEGRITGKVVVDIHVDKNGDIISATAGARGTTISDARLLQKCEEAVRNARVSALETAPETQIGQVTFVFKVN
ncbi:MAG: energy transducer TonB [Mucilaginibacter sp.]